MIVALYRGREFNTNSFSQTFRAPPGHPGKIPGYPAPKRFDFPGFEGHTELLGPHQFTWKTSSPPENIRTRKFGFVLFLRARFRGDRPTTAVVNDYGRVSGAPTLSIFD